MQNHTIVNKTTDGSERSVQSEYCCVLVVFPFAFISVCMIVHLRVQICLFWMQPSTSSTLNGCLLRSSGSQNKKRNTRQEIQLNPSSGVTGITVASQNRQVCNLTQRVFGKDRKVWSELNVAVVLISSTVCLRGCLYLGLDRLIYGRANRKYFVKKPNLLIGSVQLNFGLPHWETGLC